VRITQGAFSYLPDLTAKQIETQVQYALSKGFAINIEWTDDPHPRNVYWDMWGLPLFDCQDSAAVMYEFFECYKINPEGYIKIQAFDASLGTESCVLSFIAYRPMTEPGFYLARTEGAGRFQKYAISSYSVNNQPVGGRYIDEGSSSYPIGERP
jgi:ribulose-bisphosphate carboxylase small chain